MSLIANEQAKLSATYLNGIAIALAGVGGIGPWVAWVVQPSGQQLLRLGSSSVLCVSLSFVLHVAARKMLRLLRE
jgi:hypothetical protein